MDRPTEGTSQEAVLPPSMAPRRKAVPPDPPKITSPRTIHPVRQRVIGTSAAEMTVNVEIDGRAFNTTANSNGEWGVNIEHSRGLVLRAQAVDAHGATSGWSEPLVIGHPHGRLETVEAEARLKAMGMKRWGQRSLGKKAAEYVSSAPDEIRSSEERAAAILATVRKRADDWRNGTAGVLGLITAALVVTNAKDTARLYEHQHMRMLLVGLLVAAAILGLLSLYKVIRASNGPSWLDVMTERGAGVVAPGGGVTIAERDLIRARAAAHDLWWGQRLLAAGVLVFIALNAVMWAVPIDASLW